jgi:RTX calcium-binding nonapeptide repeat (4 copies)
MSIQTWISGRIGNWFNAANWTTGQVPVPGDSAVINTGTATVSQPVPGPLAGVAGVSILLGGLDTGQPVTLEAVDAVFEAFSGASVVNTVLTVTGGEPSSSPLNATFLAKGNTSFDGQILVSAKGGGLTIDSEPDSIGNAGNFTFNNADQKAVMVVGQESVLTFAGHTITNDGLIEVLGGTDIAAGVAFTGSGIVALESGGHMTIKGDVVGTGTVATSQKIDFADGTGSVTLVNAAGFTGVFGFVPTVSGNRIDLTQIQAQSLRYFRPTSAGLPGHLKLYAGRDGQGAELATLDMELIFAGNLGPLPFDQQDLSTADFTLASDGRGGTLVTYTPQNGIQLEQSLAAPIVAAAGTTVSFASILQNAFGTSSPGFTSITLLPIPPFANTSVDTGYWGAPNITPTWLVNGIPISGRTRVTDISRVSLVVGNQIINPASFEAVVTAATSGPQSETITYSAWSVDPAVVDRLRHEGFGAVPTPDAVIASAHAFADLYGEVPNTNLCNWIGDNVAAGAGAPMPLPDALLDPTSNVAGGFWRIAYRGSNSSLITNWSGLVLPGDIVRMGWFKPETGAESGHTTTVLGAVGANGQIRVYDNDDFVTNPSGRQEVIGVHDAAYWLATDPADITIYRLDPNQQYLIEGTPLAEVIQGSVFNDLIHSGGGADTITGGPGNNEIQDTTAHLNTVTVTDLNAGDTLDFTDLNSALAELSFTNGILTVGDGMHFAQLRLLGLTNPVFSSRSDGNGGTLVSVAGGFGDVHMMCFDGLAYDFQAVGDFVAVQSNDAGNPWQVQIRTASAPGATSITTGLAASIGDVRISFAVGRDRLVHVDGIADARLPADGVQRFAGGTLAQLSDNVYQLSWSAGRSVTITDHGSYLDWVVGLGSQDGPGSVKGLLGSNSGWSTDFQLPDGTILYHPNDAEILGVFADAWRVAPGASLLDDSSRAATALVQAMSGELVAANAAPDFSAPLQNANSQSAGDILAASLQHSSFHA